GQDKALAAQGAAVVVSPPDGPGASCAPSCLGCAASREGFVAPQTSNKLPRRIARRSFVLGEPVRAVPPTNHRALGTISAVAEALGVVTRPLPNRQRGP